MNDELVMSINRFAEDNRGNILRDISRLVAINSVQGEPKDNAPFGVGPAAALTEALVIADELGLDSINCENKIGFASIGGSGENYIATITHVDIVPPGEGWRGNPFSMREREGYIIGRGVADDKGPTIICLYALKYILDTKIPLKYPVRALLGANEESGMEDVKYYMSNYTAPLFCFSPDADFPLICGEKGIWHGMLYSNCMANNIVSMQGGFAINAIPDYCEAKVKYAGELKTTDKVIAKRIGDEWSLVSTGKAGHASQPENTENAIGVMIEYMLDNKIPDDSESDFLKLALAIHQAYDGSGIGIDASDSGGVFTPLTIISGLFGIENGRFYQSMDCRYVPSTCGEEILKKISDKAINIATVSQISDAKPFFKSPDSPEIEACMEAYKLVTGDYEAKPFTIGGATYSRDFPNAVGFGPEHTDKPHPEWAGYLHGAEESACVEDLLEALKIYIASM